MNKKTTEKFSDFFTKYAKFICPVFVVLVVAVVVVIALNSRDAAPRETSPIEGEDIVANTPDMQEPENLEVPLVLNTDEAIDSFFSRYYKLLSEGVAEDIRQMSNICDDTENLRYEEQAKYLSYEVKEIYTQVGPIDHSYICYVCCDVEFDAFEDLYVPAYNGFYIKSSEDGNFFIENGELTIKENEYISRVSSQNDVVELNNRVTVEYNEVVMEHPELLSYLAEMDALVNNAVGERLALLNTPETPDVDPDTTPEGTETAPAAYPTYATANTTVNVRVSDSEKADKLGKAEVGSKLEVVEVLLNGWTKIKFDSKEGYIKSEFLTVAEDASKYETIGKVTAKTTVNVRSQADQESDRIGVLVENDVADLVEKMDGWCKIKYEGQIGYVNSDFVE